MNADTKVIISAIQNNKQMKKLGGCLHAKKGDVSRLSPKVLSQKRYQREPFPLAPFAEKDYICSINLNMESMEQYPCENCKFRPHYDRNPKSLIGRFWRWHINFCPGWKQYFTHQTPEKQAELRERYHFEKYKE